VEGVIGLGLAYPARFALPKPLVLAPPVFPNLTVEFAPGRAPEFEAPAGFCRTIC
jgi:hypothetical protein